MIWQKAPAAANPAASNESSGSSARAAGFAAGATRAAGVCCRVALTLEDSARGVLRSGEPVGAVAARLGSLLGVEAVLLNCCAPQVRSWVRVLSVAERHL
jgi:S-methylmethionine-dependent homocysteine/selenocysteine methylase